MGVYIKGMTLEQVQTLFDMVGGEPLGEAMCNNLIEVTEPHGRLIDADKLTDKSFESDVFLSDLILETEVYLAPTVIEEER